MTEHDYEMRARYYRRARGMHALALQWRMRQVELAMGGEWLSFEVYSLHGGHP